MLRKNLLAAGVSVALAMSAASAMASTVLPGLTLTSDVGTLNVICNGIQPAAEKPITSSAQTFPWFGIALLFGGIHLNCQFDQANDGQLVGSATLNLQLTSGQITDVEPASGYSMPTITYSGPGVNDYHTGISVTLNK